MGKPVMGTKVCMCHDEHGLMYGRAESLCRTPEANTALYVNELEVKEKHKQLP